MISTARKAVRRAGPLPEDMLGSPTNRPAEPVTSRNARSSHYEALHGRVASSSGRLFA
jgi:hypothetical protein